MPIIPIAEFPVVARSGRVSAYAVQMNELAELLKMTDFGAGSAVVFQTNKDDLSALVTSLRKEASNVGRKITTVFVEYTVADLNYFVDVEAEANGVDDASDLHVTANSAHLGQVFAKDNGAADAESASATTIRTAQAGKAKK